MTSSVDGWVWITAQGAGVLIGLGILAIAYLLARKRP